MDQFSHPCAKLNACQASTPKKRKSKKERSYEAVPHSAILFSQTPPPFALETPNATQSGSEPVRGQCSFLVFFSNSVFHGFVGETAKAFSIWGLQQARPLPTWVSTWPGSIVPEIWLTLRTRWNWTMAIQFIQCGKGEVDIYDFWDQHWSVDETCTSTGNAAILIINRPKKIDFDFIQSILYCTTIRY